MSRAGIDVSIEKSLAETEQMEKEAILAQLEQYHQARRKYILDAATLATSRPNLSLSNQGQIPGPSLNTNSGFQKSTSHFPATGLSLVVPPLPQIQPKTSSREDCCEKMFPFGSSTFQKSVTKRNEKSAGTATNDLRNTASRCVF